MTSFATSSPLRRPSAGALVWWVVVALVLTGGAVSAGMMVAGRDSWWTGFLAASAVSALAAGIGLIPLLVAVQRGTHNQLLMAWVAGSMLRGGTALTGCFLSAMFLHSQPVATFLIMVLYYFAVLSAETAVLVLGLRK